MPKIPGYALAALACLAAFLFGLFVIPADPWDVMPPVEGTPITRP